MKSASNGNVIEDVTKSLETDILSGIVQLIFFSNVKGLSAGRIGSSQIIGWKCGKKIYYAIYKEINLKGMIPKMVFQVSENWKNFINMMIERSPVSDDEGLKIAKKPLGILPAYDSKDLFFDHIKEL